MLNSKQRAYLRSLASNLDTIFQIGKGGDHGIAAPVGDGGSDQIVCLGLDGNATAAASSDLPCFLGISIYAVLNCR
mgnify:CR=1 FL=1